MGSNGLMVPYELQNISHRQLYEGVRNMRTAKSRLYNVHRCKETPKPEKLYLEE